MIFLIIFALLILTVSVQVAQAQIGDSSTLQEEGQKSKPAGQGIRLYDVPSARAGSEESPEETAEYLKITQITEPASAAQLIEDFLKKYPDSKRAPVLHLGAVSLYQKLNNYEKLVEHGEKLLASAPSNISVLSTLGLAYASHGEADKAVEKASKAITALEGLAKPANVNNEAGWNAQRNQLLAMNFASLGTAYLVKYEEGRKNDKEPKTRQSAAEAGTAPSSTPPKEATVAQPQPPTAGAVSPEVINLAKSLGYLTKAVEYEPRYEYARFQLGVVHARRNEIDKAIDSFAKAVVLGGGLTAMARQNLEAMYKLRNKNSLDGIEQLLARTKEELAPPQPQPAIKP